MPSGPAHIGLPAGVKLIPLASHPDPRGRFTEIFREEWDDTDIRPIQWNVMHSEARVLRGIHVHPKHKDYLVLVAGRLGVGLQDMRLNSPTVGKSAVVWLEGATLMGVMIPNGVAHGFYSATKTILVYAVTEYWNPADELGCHWKSPGLTIPWGRLTGTPRLSERDAQAGTFVDLAQHLGPFQHGLLRV